jgi:restriction system protein
LIAIEEEEHHDKWLITTGDVSEDDKEFAQGNNVKIMEGNELIEWIYKRISRLSDYTKEVLRISVVPQIL